MIKVTYIPCLFETRRYEFESRNHTVIAIISTLVNRFPEVRKDGVGYQVRVNGKLVSPFKWRVRLNDDDRILIIQQIGIAEAIAGFLTSLAIFGTVSAATVSGILTGISLAFTLASIAYSIYSMLATKKSKDSTSTGQGLSGSKTYGWEGAQMTAEPGLPVPVIYGEHEVSGNVIGSFVSSDGNASFLNLLIELCEGPIEGIMKSDKTAVCTTIYDDPHIKINDNLMSNLYPAPGACWNYSLGGDNPSDLLGFFDTRTYYDMGSPEVSVAGGPVTYTTDGHDIQGFQVRLRVPALFSLDLSGNYQNAIINYRIFYKIHGSEDPWTLWDSLWFTGSTMNPIRQYVEVSGLPANQYDVKIDKVTADFDPEDTTMAGKLYWDSVTEIKYKSFLYPYTALLYLKLLATEKLSAQMPNIKVLLRGLKPLNLKTSVVEWSRNPVYCMNDFLTNKRYGAGRFITSTNINTDRMIEEADYCDEMVGDGTMHTGASITVTATSITDPNYTFVAGDVGKTICCASPANSAFYTNMVITSVAGTTANGTGGWSAGTPDPANVGWEFGEKRYELDICIDAQDDALTLINQICGTFRAVPLWIKDAIEFVIDRPQNAVYEMNMSNIIKSSFSDNFISPKSRPNSIEVSYADRDKDYKKEIIVYTDHEAVEANLPLRTGSMNLFGATRQSQVYREGRFHVLANKYQDEQITTKQGIDFVHLKPGEVTRVQHDVAAWGQGGRIVSATLNSVTLNKEVEIASGTYSLTVRQKNAQGLDILETRTVSDGPGFYTTLHVTSNFSAIPEAWSLWILGKTSFEPKSFRVMQTTHTPENEVELLASEYHTSVYTDTGVILTEPVESGLPNPFEIKDIINLSVAESGNVLGDGQWSIYLEVGFQKPEYVSLIGWDHAEVWISLAADAGWEHYGNAKESGFKIDSHDFLKKGNTVYIKLISCTSSMRGQWETAPVVSRVITGKTKRPSDVTGFHETQYSDRIVLDWIMPADADVKAGGYFEIRQGEVWETAAPVQNYIKTNTYVWLTFNPGEVTLLIKAVDSSGNYSLNAASITFTITILPVGTALVNVNALYGVACTDTVVQYATRGYDRAVSLRVGSKYDDPTIHYDDGTHYDRPVDPLTGYFVTAPIDIGGLAKYQFIIDSEYLAEGDGQTVLVQISTSEDNISWSAYATFSASIGYFCRYVKFKVTLTTDVSTENIFCGKFSLRAYSAEKTFWGTAAPTTGTWARGDIVWNAAAAAGGTPGWMCVVAGTPGTWKAMAALAA